MRRLTLGLWGLLALTLLVALWTPPTWAGGGTPVAVSNRQCLQVNLSHGTLSTGTLITTTIPASSNQADGEWLFVIRRRVTAASTSSVMVVSALIASNAVSGTPLCSDYGPSLTTTCKVGVSGGFVTLCTGGLGASSYGIDAYFSGTLSQAWAQGWAITDANSGTSTTRSNAMTALSLSGALSGATTGAFSGDVSLTGANFVAITSGNGLLSNTSDASDNKFVQVSGGGAFGNDRAGGLSAYGNEHSTNPGCFHFAAGDIAGGCVRLFTGAGLKRFEVDYGGNISVNGPIVFASPQPASPAPSPGMRTIFHDNVSGGLGFSTSGNFSFYGATGGEILRHSATVWRLLSGYWELSTANTASAPAGTVRNINPNGNATDLAYNVPSGGSHQFTVAGTQAAAASASSWSTNGLSWIMNGSPSNPAGTSRWTSGGSTSSSWYHNVPTGGDFNWSINAVNKMSLDSNGHLAMASTGDLLLSDGRGLRENSADGSDNRSLSVNGGGGLASNTRGGNVQVYGNEHSTQPGRVFLEAGNVAGGIIRCFTGAATRWTIDENGLNTNSCGQVNAWTTKTANYTMQATDYGVVVDATSSSLNITLPTNSAGRTVHIKRIDSSGNTVTLIPPSGNIRGAANITLSASFAAGYEAILIGNGGSQWY